MSMIPGDKQDAVKKGLQSAFGVKTYDDIHQLTAGLSTALVFRIVVQSRSYLLKIITRTDALGDPTQLYACMNTAAGAGLAPRVWYTSIEDKISITDFIDAKPFPITEARIRLADVLCKLHLLPPFPKTIHSLDTSNLFARKFQDANILPENITEELFREFEKITAIYPRNKSDLVACHNDLKPENILYDGDQAWLVDWEAIFTNDRYSDLAIVANFVVKDETDETEFLERYFGRKVTEYESARFYLMQQILHMSYFVVFMVVVSARVKLIDLNTINKYDFRDFHNRMWAGEINLATDETKLEYARVHMEQLHRNMGTKRFEDALRIVSITKIN